MNDEIKGELVLPVKPQLQILNRQSVLDFGIIYNGTVKHLKFAIKNCGHQSLHVNFSAGEDWISTDPASAVLDKGEIREITVSARPEDIKSGRQKITLLVNSNDLLEQARQINILAQIEENSAPIELNPQILSLDSILPKKIKSVKIEVKNTDNSEEAPSVEVEINPDDSYWLSYEIEGVKSHLYINFKINPKIMEPGDYKTVIRIREIFSPDATPLELPLSFTVPSENDRKTAGLDTKENVGNFIKGLVFKEEENDDILYTDQKTYSTSQFIYIAIAVIVIILALALFIIFRVKSNKSEMFHFPRISSHYCGNLSCSTGKLCIKSIESGRPEISEIRRNFCDFIEYENTLSGEILICKEVKEHALPELWRRKTFNDT
ncbi:MAG: hypothetical protein ABRQ38_03540 [Candidatus Eremiobacterota bacterium]